MHFWDLISQCTKYGGGVYTINQIRKPIYYAIFPSLLNLTLGIVLNIRLLNIAPFQTCEYKLIKLHL